jgi:hypothetical protein
VRRLSLFEVSVTSIGRQQEAFTTVVEQRTLEQGRALRAELAASSPTLRAAKARLEIVQARILLSEAMAPDGTRRPTAATERRRKTLHDR